MIIGLASLRPQVGKTTISDHLIKNFNFTAVEMSTPVIYISEKFFGYNGNKHDPNQRKILQSVGYMGKQIDPAIWLYYSLMGLGDGSPEKYMNYKSYIEFKNKTSEGKSFLGYTNVIVSGVRSPLEADEIKKLGGQVWLVKRNDANMNESFQHKVENELSTYDGFSETIDNNSTFDDLYGKIDQLLKTILI